MSSTVDLIIPGLIAPVAAVLAGPAMVLYGVGKGVVDAINIVNEDKKLQKDAWQEFKKVSKEKSDLTNINNYINKILEIFNKKTSFTTFENAKKLISEGRGALKQFEIAQKLVEIQSKYQMMTNNFYTLNDLSEKLEFNIDEILKLYHDLKNDERKLSVEKFDELISKLNEKILAEIKARNDEIEKAIENKVYDKKFLNVQQVPEDLFYGIFENELAAMLEAPEMQTEEVQSISKRKQILDLQKQIYVAVETMRNLPGFEKYSQKVLALYGGVLNLSDRSDLSLEDLDNLIKAKKYELDQILSYMEVEQKELYIRKLNFMKLVGTNNYYRDALNMEHGYYEFNPETYEDDIKKIQNENEALYKKYQQNYTAKYISAELRAKYVQRNYEYIPCDEVIETEVTVNRRSYFITPDGENVLIVNVNENGHISEKVVAVETEGLPLDINSTMNAQHTFCKHSQQVVNELLTSLNLPKESEYIVEPSEEYVYAVNFEGIIPTEYLNKIQNKKKQRNTQVTPQHREVK